MGHLPYGLGPRQRAGTPGVGTPEGAVRAEGRARLTRAGSSLRLPPGARCVAGSARRGTGRRWHATERTRGRLETAEIVVIGGGIAGCSVAYHLARKGCRGVALLEKDLVCFGSTGKSAGGIRVQFSSEVNIRLSLEALKILAGFQEEVGVDPGFRQTGYLFLATTDAELEIFRKNVALQQRL